MTGFLRFRLFALAALYMLLSIGFGVKLHYCHGNLSSVSYVTSTPACSCEKGFREMKCCSDVQQFYQLDEETMIREVIQNDVFVIGNAHISEENEIPVSTVVISGLNAEPEYAFPPKYISNHSLIFYA